MKVLRLFSAILFVLSSAMLANATAVSSQSAAYYFLRGQTLVGTTAKLSVVSAKPLDISITGNYVCFECETVDAKSSWGKPVDGGSIVVIVPQWRAETFFDKYAKPPAPAELKGTIKRFTWDNGLSSIILFIDSV